MAQRLTPRDLLMGYASGIFPMAESADSDDIYWMDPDPRGVMPLDNFHLSKSLIKLIKAQSYTITFNQDFKGVLQGCSAREETWINAEITALYIELFDAGFAHSIEVYHDNILIGGAYGVALGAAFFGESMFSLRPNASKVALAYLCHRLKSAGFTLLDTQYLTDHLASLGAIEISRNAYRKNLEAALDKEADFTAPALPHWSEVIKQRNTQTS